MLLEVDRISSGYGGKRVVQAASLGVAAGEVVALVGPNGTGKTTLLDTIFGLRPVDEGAVRFDGVLATGRSPAENLEAGIAYAPQGGRVYKTLSIAENLEIGGFVRTAAERAAALAAVYRLFPILWERRSGRAGLLSGGERQMLAIGMALSASPRLILLDEPSGGLSPLFVERAFETIRAIAKDMAMAVLLVEQNLAEAFAVADRAYVMAGGAVVAEGTPAALAAADRLSTAFFGATDLEPAK